jgi:hypothetical protein
MGFRYVVFRVWYEFTRKTGLLKKFYPTETKCNPVSIAQFIQNAPQFLPMQYCSTSYSPEERELLQNDYTRIINGEYPFFSGQYFVTGHHSWLKNPLNGYCYNSEKHWTEIADIDPAAGDIKFVWERARFSWIYILLRADCVLEKDSARFLFDSILSFIDHSPDNCGPHWRCGQEISLRVLNWIAILFFYRERLEKIISEGEFNRIISSVYSQIKHVYQNRNFARIAVRNNHAITEALGLYVTGVMFPWFSESKKWKINGKGALVKEGLYQIYPDGAYIQHSFNYQRTVTQLYTFALAIAHVHNDTFPVLLTERLKKMVEFLFAMQDTNSGSLPNYGANDGALFFPIGRGTYCNYRSQINALHAALYNSNIYTHGSWYDETAWFCGGINGQQIRKKLAVAQFEHGGYYTLRNETSYVMIRCASYRHRPSQADQLHVDIWDRGKNIIHDSGSFTYDMSDPLFRFFAGTASHNTVQIAGYDQMERGPRFIWYKWPVCLDAKVYHDDSYVCFAGASSCYRHIAKKGILHERNVVISRDGFFVEITDHLEILSSSAKQIWNLGDQFEKNYIIKSYDSNGEEVTGEHIVTNYSATYGIHTPAKQLVVQLTGGYLRTIIRRKKDD